MNCPTEIAPILLRVIAVGLLRIRSFSDDPDRCSTEADHIHNLPDLVLDYSPSKLSYYWEVERPAFLDQNPGAELSGFEPLWDELRAHAEAHSVAGTN